MWFKKFSFCTRCEQNWHFGRYPSLNGAVNSNKTHVREVVPSAFYLLQFFLCLCQIYDRSPFTGGGNQTHVTIPEDNLTTTALYHSATKVFIKFRMVWGCRRKIVLWYRDVGSIPAAGKRNTINTSMSINVVRLVSTNGRYTCPSWNQSMNSRPLNLEENLNSV